MYSEQIAAAWEKLTVARRLVAQAARAAVDSPTADAKLELVAVLRAEEIARQEFEALTESAAV